MQGKTMKKGIKNVNKTVVTSGYVAPAVMEQLSPRFERDNKAFQVLLALVSGINGANFARDDSDGELKGLLIVTAYQIVDQYLKHREKQNSAKKR